MYGYADYATAMRRMRERLPKEYPVFQFMSSISFLFNSALAGTLQLPSSSDTSSSVIYVIPSPLQKSKILSFKIDVIPGYIVSDKLTETHRAERLPIRIERL